MEHLSQFISNHAFLWGALAVIVILILINESIALKQKASELSPQALVDMMNNEHAVIIDIRDQESYKMGHIIDAININPTDVDQNKMNKYKNKPLVVVCAKGTQGQATVGKLKDLGFTAQLLNGGMVAWLDAELPTVKDKG